MSRRPLRSAHGWAVTTLLVWGPATFGGVWASSIDRATPVAGAIGADVAEPAEAKTGGETTVFDDGPTAFGRTLANLQDTHWEDVIAGKERFRRRWPRRGPWADATSCASCHANDGRGPQAGRGDEDLSHLLRLGHTSEEGDPIYGTQLRRAGYGVPAPGRFTVEWSEVRGRYASGEPYTLRRPTAQIRNLAFGPIDPGTRLSLRVPPAVFGLGLLEAVSEREILAAADPDDSDADGISGRARWVRDPSTGHTTLGRFGWKAAQPTLAAQIGAALAVDLGVINPAASRSLEPFQVARSAQGLDRPLFESLSPNPQSLRYTETKNAPERAGGPAGKSIPEVAGADVNALVQYLRVLAVPGRRHWAESVVRRGQALFSDIGCGSCHRLQFTTMQMPGWPELSHQTIRPYSDMLLHDLGASLADDVDEGSASGREWRTAPLWGLGLLSVVSGSAGLLHDGRARSPEEAILWHGGEAEAARATFSALPLAERRALLTFLSTL